jgi:hypothetical protein
LSQPRSNLGHLIAAAGGVLLFLSLFLAWLSGGGSSLSAWETFSGIDIVLAVLALTSAAIAIAAVMGATLPVPWLGPQRLRWLGLIALTIVLTFVIEADNLGFGAFIAVIAAAAVLLGGILNERPDLEARLAEASGVSGSSIGGGSPSAPGPGAPSPPASSTATQPLRQPAGASGSGSPGMARPPAGGPPPGAAPPAPSSPAAPAPPAPSSPAAPAPPAQSAGPPAGWYPDPQGQARLRYWDGATWTEQTSA